MVISHTAVSYSAKGKIGIGHMGNQMIDASATKLDTIQEILFNSPTPGKQIQRKRIGVMLNNIGSLRELLIGYDRENRAKDFLFH